MAAGDGERRAGGGFARLREVFWHGSERQVAQEIEGQERQEHIALRHGVGKVADAQLLTFSTTFENVFIIFHLHFFVYLLSLFLFYLFLCKLVMV